MFKKIINIIKSYKFLVVIFSILTTVAVGFLIVKAGSLNPTTTPADTFHTLEDIYCKLNGTGCDPLTSYGIDSSASPAATMHTLTEIYNNTPDYKTNPGTADAADVFEGKTFYTFDQPTTRQTGTLDVACNTDTFNGTANLITDTDYDGSGSGNNRWCMKETGDAAESDIGCGKVGWVDGEAKNGTGAFSCPNAQCYACEGGSCVAKTTNWGAGLYGCTDADERCVDGVCKDCSDLSGYLYNDGCSGCAGQGGNACWHVAAANQSCTTYCASYGGCIAADWNDSGSSTTYVCKHWWPSGNSGQATGTGYPAYRTDLFICSWRSESSQSCDTAIGSLFRRFCVCQY